MSRNRRQKFSFTESMHATVTIAALLMLALLVVPLIALFLRAVGSSNQALPLLSEPVLDAMRLSLVTTTISMVWIVLFGTPLAYALARYRFPYKRTVSVLVELPIVLPPVVAGLALLMTFGRRGLLGPVLSAAGISLPFTPIAIVLAQVFVSSPFYIRAVQTRFETIPRDLEEAASIDGAGDWRIFHTLILPLSSRAILTGLVLSWARALGEFGATILFAGNLQGRTQTMPLLVYGALERDLDAALWTALILIGIAAITLGLVNRLARALSIYEDTDPSREG